MTLRFLPWRSIHARITLITLGLFVASLWSLSHVTSQILKNDLQKLLSEQQFSTAYMVANRVNDELERRMTALKSVAEFSSIALLSGPAAIQEEINQRPVIKGLFNNGIFVCNIDGTTVANSLSSEQLCNDYVNIEVVTTTLREGKSSIGHLVSSKDKRDLAFGMATPIFDEKGKIIGALAGMIKLDMPNFIDKITEQPYGVTGGYLIICPSRRQIISATDKSRELEVLPAPGVNPELDRFLLGYQGSQLMQNPHGVEILASDIRIAATGWILAAVLPVEEAFAPIQRIQRHMMIGIILLTLLSGLLSWWVLKRQLAPLIVTVQTLDAITNGTQNRHPLPVTRDDEIGSLINAFNHLLATLGHREKALQKNEIFSHAIINSVPAEIAVLDHEGAITMVNHPWIRFYRDSQPQPDDYTSISVIGVNYRDIYRSIMGLASQDKDSYPYSEIEAVLTGQLPSFKMEYRFDSASQQRWFNLVVTPLDHDNRGVVISRTEITERKQIEESLRLFRTSIQDASEPIYWVASDSRIVDVNSAACQLVGYSMQELLQMQVSDLNQEQQFSQERWNEHFARLRQQGSMKFETVHRAKDGRLIPVEVMASYVRHGEEEFSCAFIRDITERKKNEIALRAAKAEAEKANNAKSRFLAAASHDLRQPLSALSLYINLLEHHVSPGSKDIVNNIQHCVVSLSELLTDLLDISKLDAGVINPKLSNFVLDDLLTTLASVYVVESATKNLQLRVRPSGITLYSDQRLLHRIIGNLISNAVRYTEKGGVLIACRRHENKMWLEVWDTGVGIPEGKTKIIFEEFTQLGDEARNRGSGLGLSIVSKMASLLGLEIRVRSRIGIGSIFALELPCATNQQDNSSDLLNTRLTENTTIASDIQQTQMQLSDQQEKESGSINSTINCHSSNSTPAYRDRVSRETKGFKIAVVDDNPQVLQALTLAMENYGYQVIAAATGNQLMDRLTNSAPDLILSDYRLAEGENGFDVIKTARAQYGAELPAIIMTGDTDPSVIRSMGVYGITILYKPVQFDTLQVIINEAILQGKK